MNVESFLYKCVAKKRKGITYCGVYHDPETQQAVATNARVLVAMAEGYKPEYAGKVVAKDGTIIDGVFPKWRNVIPREYPQNFDINVDMGGCKQRIDKAVAMRKLVNVNYYIRVFEGDETNRPIWCDYSYARLARTFSQDGWLAHNGYNEMVCQKENGDIMVVMPVVLRELYEREKHLADTHGVAMSSSFYGKP